MIAHSHLPCSTLFSITLNNNIHFFKTCSAKTNIDRTTYKVGADTGGEKNLSTSVTDSLCRKYINTKMQD